MEVLPNTENIVTLNTLPHAQDTEFPSFFLFFKKENKNCLIIMREVASSTVKTWSNQSLRVFIIWSQLTHPSLACNGSFSRMNISLHGISPLPPPHSFLPDTHRLNPKQIFRRPSDAFLSQQVGWHHPESKARENSMGGKGPRVVILGSHWRSHLFCPGPWNANTQHHGK